jgi:hypothetical protein
MKPTDPKAPFLVVAAPIEAFDQDFGALIAKYAIPPGPDGTVPAALAHERRASILRSALLATAALAVQSRRLGLIFTRRDFVEAAGRDYDFVSALERGERPGARS